MEFVVQGIDLKTNKSIERRYATTERGAVNKAKAIKRVNPEVEIEVVSPDGEIVHFIEGPKHLL